MNCEKLVLIASVKVNTKRRIEAKSATLATTTVISWTKLIKAFVLTCLVFSFSAVAQTKTDKPMEAKALATLVKEFKGIVSRITPDKDEAKLVGKKWDNRKDLTGKTKSEVIELLFKDVKSVIKDSGTQYQIYSMFSFYKTIPDDPPTDKPKEAKAFAALVEELKGVVSRMSPDKNEAKLVGEKWDARKDLAGKTQSEVIELLYADVKSVIKDSGTQYQIYSIFSFYKTIPIKSPQKQCETASKFGADDQIGNLNYITPEKTLAASKLVTKGKSYSLAIETNKDTPAFPPRTFSLTVVQPNQTAGATLGPTKSTYNDDKITGWVGIGTGIDGLGHVGIDNLYFNCNKAADFVASDGLKKLGVENIPAVATRGVLLDMAGYFKTDMVKEGTAFNKAEIEGAMKRQSIRSLEKGDVVMFYTGWMKLMGKDNKRFAAGNPGVGIEGAKYLASRGVAIVGADNENAEVVPFEKGAGVFEVHQILIAKNGIYIIENMNLEELVKDKVWESLFTLGSPRITGGVQAIVNPIAIR